MTEFTTVARMRDGYLKVCKPCKNTAYKQWRAAAQKPQRTETAAVVAKRKHLRELERENERLQKQIEKAECERAELHARYEVAEKRAHADAVKKHFGETREAECAASKAVAAIAREARTARPAQAVKAKAFKAEAVTAVKTISDLVTFDSLKGTARRLKGQPAVYKHGRTCITAVYNRTRDDFDFTVSGWPAGADDMARVFAQIESGQGLKGMF
ncbi:hypothetical protein [Burkholderia sp. PAMC 28687]|uniref:hypothetical protein n=1 Tax=Burkholderia sp. PAMC 28687 TaxID=1795874 RepID=UPI0012D77262|nr:hypothetical protein [Burkholderia sp. PAMC 28687]